MKILVTTVMLLILSPLLSAFNHLSASERNIIINELIPNPVGSDTLFEWIELYNYSEEEIILSGWKLDGKQIPDSTIQPKGFLILVRDLSSYPEIEDKVKVDFNLVNTGDQIELRDNNNDLIDVFIYTSSTEGKSLERLGPDCDGYSQHQSTHTLALQNSNYTPNCYFDNEEESPILSNIIFSIDNVNWFDSIESEYPVEIYFELETEDDYQTIWSDNNGNLITSPWLFEGYSGNIFAKRLIDDKETIIQSQSIVVKPFLSEKIQISEIYPNINSGEEEWVELFNYDDRDIDLSQYYLTDSGDCSVGAKNFLEGVINAQSYSVKFRLETKITLNDGGDSVQLCDRNLSKLDELIYLKSTKGKSISKRFVDNKYLSEIFESIPSPGSLNIEPIEEQVELIKLIETQSLEQNTKVRVQGHVISTINSLFQNTFFMQDNSSGLRVYSDLGIDLIVGQKVEIEGTISRINGDNRIKASKITRIDEYREFEVRKLSFEMLESQIGSRVSIEGYIVNNYSSSFDIDYNSNLVRVSILKEDILSSIQKSKGDFASILGILIFDKDRFRILPENLNDINITTNEEAKSPQSTRASRGTLRIEDIPSSEVKGVESPERTPQKIYFLENDNSQQLNKTGPILVGSSVIAFVALALTRFLPLFKKLFTSREEIILPMK